MIKFIVKQSMLSGAAEIPTSKSHSLRAILFASLADGESLIENYLLSPDAAAMIHACRMLGADIEDLGKDLRIRGVAGKPCVPDDVINSGNSGQVLRFVGALAGLIDGYTVMTGDDSVRHNRPVKPLLLGLEQLGAFARSSRGDDKAPIIIAGKMQPGTVKIDGQDSQPVSGLLIAAQFLAGETELFIDNAGEKPWVQLTLTWFDRLGLSYTHENYEYYKIPGHAAIKGFNYRVPGDFSSLAFPVAAALMTQSEVTITPVDMNDSQGDKKLLDVLVRMGAEFDYDQTSMSLTVKPCQKLTGVHADINDFIDSVTILAVLGTVAEGETVISNASIARRKECNRLQAICTELKKMGADIEETDDGLIVRQSQLKACDVLSYHDHRMAMSLAVAALVAEGETVINDVACVKKSFPGFAECMQTLGMNIKEVS